MASVVAIDIGTKKCGFAVADALRLSVTLLPTAHVSGESIELLRTVEKLLRERDVDVLLVGMPYNMDGTASGQSIWTSKCIDRLRLHFANLEIVPYDERLTSKEAESRLFAEGLTFEQMRKHRDSTAAAVLLQDWIAAGEPRA